MELAAAACSPWASPPPEHRPHNRIGPRPLNQVWHDPLNALPIPKATVSQQLRDQSVNAAGVFIQSNVVILECPCWARY